MAIINSGNVPKLVELSSPNITVYSYGYITSNISQPESGFVKKGSKISHKQLELSELRDLINIYVDITNNSILGLSISYYSLPSTNQAQMISLLPNETAQISMTPGILSINCSGTFDNLVKQKSLSYSTSPNSADVHGFVSSQSFIGEQSSYARPYLSIYIKKECSLTLS